MTTDCAVCYVSDLNFLMPTLASITGVRKYVPVHKADIYLFLLDVEESLIQQMKRFLEPYGVKLLSMDSHFFNSFDSTQYNKNHVPPSTLGRLFMDTLLPDSCRRIVYLDGDTWIKGDPSALIEAVIPEGRFAAVEDNYSLLRNNVRANGRTARAYFDGLGIKDNQGYFNAGVFATSRTTWRKISEEAFAYFKQNTAACKFHDQSALNAVMGDRRINLSLRWNFHTPYRYYGIEGGIKPNVYHFTQPRKPWMGACKPWEELKAPYRAFIDSLGSLKLPYGTLDPATVERENKTVRKELIKLRTYLLPRLIIRRMAIRNYEATAWL